MDLSFRSAQRALQEWAPDLPLLADDGAVLEALAPVAEPPRLAAAEVLEGGTLRAREVPGEPELGFAAFMDGIQRSRVLQYLEGLPVVYGVVAAVIRTRIDRRLHTWTGKPRIHRRIYLPGAYLPAGLAAHLGGDGREVVDTTRGDSGTAECSRHPHALLDLAVHHIQRDRERAERELAARWCELERLPLFVDGGLSRSDALATSEFAIGVVKSHRTLYVDGKAMEYVFGLRRGERSSVFQIEGAYATRVASWYLRLRDPAGHDPLWGLVRVEVSYPVRLQESGDALSARADLVSRWILAEAAPLALPDGRWDRMVYGIRDCEEYLRASV